MEGGRWKEVRLYFFYLESCPLYSLWKGEIKTILNNVDFLLLELKLLKKCTCMSTAIYPSVVHSSMAFIYMYTINLALHLLIEWDPKYYCCFS